MPIAVRLLSICSICWVLANHCALTAAPAVAVMSGVAVGVEVAVACGVGVSVAVAVTAGKGVRSTGETRSDADPLGAVGASATWIDREQEASNTDPATAVMAMSRRNAAVGAATPISPLRRKRETH